MTDTVETATVDQHQGGEERLEGTKRYLEPVVWDMQALQIAGKQAHWHLRGRNFIAVHELLDSVVTHARGYADLAAERVVALGLPLDGRLDAIAEHATLPKMQDGFQDWEATITQVVAQMDAAIATVREAVQGLDDIDLNSQDVVVGIERGLVEDRWFLAAHLAQD